jgi:HPt (histidine-containing phosphotransfer) domain-containing protein/ABC-type transporter Mla MlaB component
VGHVKALCDERANDADAGLVVVSNDGGRLIGSGLTQEAMKGLLCSNIRRVAGRVVEINDGQSNASVGECSLKILRASIRGVVDDVGDVPMAKLYQVVGDECHGHRLVDLDDGQLRGPVAAQHDDGRVGRGVKNVVFVRLNDVTQNDKPVESALTQPVDAVLGSAVEGVGPDEHEPIVFVTQIGFCPGQHAGEVRIGEKVAAVATGFAVFVVEVEGDADGLAESGAHRPAVIVDGVAEMSRRILHALACIGGESFDADAVDDPTGGSDADPGQLCYFVQPRPFDYDYRVFLLFHFASSVWRESNRNRRHSNSNLKPRCFVRRLSNSGCPGGMLRRQMNGSDSMMLDLFRSELDVHLPVLTGGLLAMEKGDSAGDFNAMMRAAHSVKGAARIVGLSAIVDVAHILEDCFTAADEKRITLTSANVDDLLAGVDLIGHLAQSSDATADRAKVEFVVQRVKDIRDGKAATSKPALTTVAATRKTLALPATLDATSIQTLQREIASAPTQVVDLKNVTHVHSGFVALLSVIAATRSPTEFINATEPMKSLLKLAGVERGAHE